MRDNLKAKSLAWLHASAREDFTEEKKQAIAAWSQNV